MVCTALSEQARRDPERVAVTAGADSITFGELDSRVRALAAQVISRRRHLPDEALAPTAFDGWSGSVLPVAVDRSIGSVIAFHASLRIGMPFCPIDPATPRSRLLEILERIGRPALALAGSPALAAVLPQGVTVLGEHTAGDGEPASGDEDSVAVDGASPGYIIFTSGSTGRPKAVVRRWASFDRFATVPDRSPGIADDATWQVAVPQPLHFGGSHRALAQLAFGNTVHLVDPSSMPTDSLLEWFGDRGIQDVGLSDTLAQSLARNVSEPHRLGSLVTIRMGSEATNWETVVLLRHLASPSVTVRVGYAASEVSRTFEYVVGPDEPLGTGRVPLGRPTDADSVRLEPIDGDSDSALRQIVATDVSAYGYLDDPELNAARFSRDGLGRSWWRSGDLAEIDANGTWHHRGRVDDLLKINGLLVAPQEAEHSLRAIPGIAAAAVLPEQRSSGKWRLVAHVCVDDPLLTPEAVRAHLLDTLPAHLVPSFLVRHDNLPFNSRNKLDREALRSRHRERWRSTAPRAIWDERALWLLGQLTEILDVEDLSVDDDIWNLGLDSLDAVEFCARIADAGFGEIEPPELLTHRTASAIAARMNRDGAEEHSPVVGFNPEGALPPIFAIPGGGGTALAFRSLAGALGTDQPLYVIEPLGLHQPHRPDLTVPALARSARLEIDRRHAHGAPVVVIGYSAGASAAYEIVRQLEQEGRSARLVLLDAAPGRAGRSGLGAPPTAPRPGHGSIPSPLARLRRRTRTRLVLDMPTMAVRWAGRTLKPRLRVLRLVTTGSTSATRRYRSDHYDAFRRITRRAVNRYRVEPIEAPVDLFAAEVGDAAARCRAVVGGVTVHQVAGDHFTMLQPPHVSGLATALRSLLSAG